MPCAGRWLQVRVHGNQFSWVTSVTFATCEDKSRDVSLCYIKLLFADFQVTYRPISGFISGVVERSR